SLSAVLGGEPPAERHDADGGQERQERAAGRDVLDHAGETAVAQNHLARHVAENAATDPDDPGEAVHQHGEEATAPDDDRQREADAEDDEKEIAVGGGGDGEHVVQAHDRVGDDDDPDRLSERAALADVALGPGLLADELERDPEEHETAQELQQGDTEEERRDRDERDAQAHRSRRPPDPAPELLALGQRAHGERDDQRVVAGQREIDDHDTEEPGPELGVHEEQHTSLHQRLEHRDQDAAHDQERDGDRQAFVTVHSHLVSPYEMDGRDAPPGGGSGQETGGMTKLVVVERRGGRVQRGARRRMERR